MSFSLDKRVELELREMPGNHVCCDCDAKNPQWASVSFGVFMCLECSGRHRALGVHISFVRSVSMDSWNEKQIQKMRVGGNDQCIQFLQKYGIPKSMPIPQKYNTPAAALYRDRIDAAANGRPLPTELPTGPGNNSGTMSGAGSTHSSTNSLSSSGVAQGTDPLPGESEAAYVARQRILQEEARERMRQKFGASNGLRSGSGSAMMGIGSDPNYRPGQGGGAGGRSGSSSGTPDISELSANAFSFVSSWADTITKTTQQLVQEATAHPSSKQGSSGANSGNSSAHGGSAGNSGGGGEQSADPWAAIATGAVGFWKQATEVTSDLVNIITKPEDDQDFKFPRPQGYQDKPSTTSTTSTTAPSLQHPAGTSHTSTSQGRHSRQHTAGSSESWDNLEDLGDEGDRDGWAGQGQGQGQGQGEHSPYDTYPGSPGIAAQDRHGSSGSGSGRAHHPPTTTSTASLSNSTSAPNMRRNVSSGSTGSVSSATAASTTNRRAGSNTPGRATSTPTGDDFFANFGI